VKLIIQTDTTNKGKVIVALVCSGCFCCV